MNDDTSLYRKRLRFVLFTLGVLLALNVVGALFTLSWKAVAFNTALILTLDVIFIVRYRDRRLLTWLVFGLVAGFAELPVDAWLVAGTDSLVYPPNEPMLWDSPAYMPFSWAMVLIQLGVLADALRRKFSLLAASLLIAVIGGINIPIYEHLAHLADWWSYRDTPMLFAAPYYVIVAEAILALPLAWFGRLLDRPKPLGTATLLGLAEGVVMFVAVWIGWTLLGPCTGALLQIPCS